MSLIVTDQMGHQIEVPQNPTSIISLVPSQTELLFDLGLESCIKGITKFCIHPTDRVKSIEKIGGTKNFKFDQIDALQPDLIIGNKEENYKEGIEILREKYPVWMSDISNLEESFEMITQISELVGRQDKGEKLVSKMRTEFEKIELHPPKRTLYFIWRKPFMVAGKGTFIDDMISKIGLINAVMEERYPKLSLEQIKTLKPEVILLSSEPYPFKAKHFSELSKVCPNADLRIVDGEMFSWYGSRLLKAPAYFNSLDL